MRELKLITTFLLGLIIFTGFTGVGKSNTDVKETGNAIAASYYIDGKAIEISNKDLPLLQDKNHNYNLPYDPYTPKEKIRTKGYVCAAGYEYDGRKMKSGFVNKKSGTRYANKTSSTVNYTSHIGSDFYNLSRSKCIWQVQMGASRINSGL